MLVLLHKVHILKGEVPVTDAQSSWARTFVLFQNNHFHNNVNNNNNKIQNWYFPYIIKQKYPGSAWLKLYNLHFMLSFVLDDKLLNTEESYLIACH